MFLSSDYPHSCLIRNSAGCSVHNCLWSAQHWGAEHVEPKVVDNDYGFGHETLVLPHWRQPKPAIHPLAFLQTDRTDDFFRRCFQSQGPMPLVSPLTCRKCNITAVAERSIGWIGPRHDRTEIFDDFP